MKGESASFWHSLSMASMKRSVDRTILGNIDANLNQVLFGRRKIFDSFHSRWPAFLASTSSWTRLFNAGKSIGVAGPLASLFSISVLNEVARASSS
jgi:hypothetical protein